MTIAIAYLIWGVILAVVLGCVAVTIVAARDALNRGDRHIERAMEQMEAARNVTGHVKRSA